MRFHLTIRMDNAAFEYNPEEQTPNQRDHELARILREVAAKIEWGHDYATYQTIFDVNGNDVGFYIASPLRESRS